MNEYFNQRAQDYFNNSQSGIWGLVKNKEIKTVIDLLNIENGFKVLDLGCGPGIYLKHLKDKYSIEETGIDLSPQMISYAKEKLNLNCIVSDIGEYESKIKFNIILCLGVFEFLNNPEIIFKKSNSLSTKDGQLIVLLPKNNFLNKIYKYYHSNQGCATYLHKKEAIISLAKKYQFELKEEKNLFHCHVLKFYLI